MKRLLILLLSCVCLFFLSCDREKDALISDKTDFAIEEENVAQEDKTASSNECRLIVNGKDITEGNYVLIDHIAKHAELPVTAIFNELGYNAEMKYREETDSYIVTINQDDVFVDTQYDDYGLSLCAGDTDYVRSIIENEIIVDSDSIFTIMYWAYNAEIKIDYATNTVYVDSNNPYAFSRVNGTLVVNGKNITEGNYVRIVEFDTYTDAELPLLAIATELGANVEWQSESVVSITYNGKKEIYDAADPVFGVPGVDGSLSFRKIVDEDMIFDATSMEELLEQLFNASIKIDEDNRIIYIDSAKGRNGIMNWFSRW